jgi:hypothetical protein
MSEIAETENACAVVGELVLLASALDHQLNRICILLLGLNETPMLEPIVASLDSARKIEILKAYSVKLSAENWKTAIRKHAEGVEKINRARNKAAHSVLIFENGKAVLFSPAFAKLLSSVDLKSKVAKKLSISGFRNSIKDAERTIGEGHQLIENLMKFQGEVKRREKTKNR